MPDLTEIRLREDAQQVRWALFIDGIQYCWTNDNGQGPGSLLGSGAQSWIGLSENSILGVEVVGNRTMLPGLVLPSTIRESIDVKSAEANPSPVTFQLHDDEAGTLADLFGRETKPFDILGERIGAGTTATAATGLGQGGAVIGLWGRNIGIERIGAAGQRRLFPALPTSLVGHEHSVHQDAPGPEGLPPILVSDDPIQMAGRLVTLYAIYRDPDDPTELPTAWPTWDDQDAAGNRMWVGKVLGVKRQKAGVWALQCHGRDGLIRKQLGRVTLANWQPISTELSYGTNEDGIAVFFERRDVVSPSSRFNSLNFNTTTLTATTKDALVAEIDQIIEDVIDGTTTSYVGSEGNLDAWQEAATDQNADAGLLGGAPASFFVRKRDMSSDQTILVMHVAMHAKVWRQLGFEPETQNFDAQNNATENDKQARFVELVAGEEFQVTLLVGENVPDADGYWVGRFTTVAVGAAQILTDGNEWDNDGDERHYLAKFAGEPFTMNMQANNQLVRIGDAITPYVEGQLTVPVSGDDVDGAAGERARYWAIRGNVLVDPEGDPEETVQVARLEWVDGNYGTIDPGTGAQPAAILKEWMDPRTFGFPFTRLTGLDYWTGVAGGEGQIEAVPLAAYAYLNEDKPEYADNVWGQIILSTGSGTGLVAGVIQEGDNSPGVGGTLRWGSDVELADLGCAVPYQLVRPLAEVRAVFDELPGGYNGPLQRVRHAQIGPFLAQDILVSIMRPRRLIWSFHGDQIGVVRLAPFSPLDADIIIRESDLYGDGDPRSHIPDQAPAPAGNLDGVRLEYRWQPDEARTREELELLARDAEASSRTGELIERVVDRGLLDTRTLVDVGVAQWRPAFEQLWAVDAAEFFAQNHYTITLRVSRPKGQDLRPGTRVLLTNPWPADNGGGYGLVDHVGIVVDRSMDTSTHATRVAIFVFAGQAQGFPFFAPMARILDQSGAVLTISTDQYGHGNASIEDGDGFNRPSFSSAAEDRTVRILHRIGETFTIGGTHTVVSYSSPTLTLNTAPDTDFEYADRWVLFGNFDAQTSDSYVRTVFGAIVLDDLTHGMGPTVGRPFIPE